MTVVKVGFRTKVRARVKTTATATAANEGWVGPSSHVLYSYKGFPLMIPRNATRTHPDKMGYKYVPNDRRRLLRKYITYQYAVRYIRAISKVSVH